MSVLFLGGTIRRGSETRWFVIQDGTREPLGISKVELLTDRVRVTYDFTAGKVVSFQATPNEAFAASGVLVGVAPGLTYADVFFYRTDPSPAQPGGLKPIQPGRLANPNANVWLAGWFLNPEEGTP